MRRSIYGVFILGVLSVVLPQAVGLPRIAEAPRLAGGAASESMSKEAVASIPGVPLGLAGAGPAGSDWSEFPPSIALAVDDAGAVYIGGSTSFFDASLSKRRVGPTGDVGGDLFLAKLDSAGRLLDAMVMGGSGEDRLTALAVDAGGSVLAVGVTDSEDFPLTQGAGNRRGGGIDIFVVRLDGDPFEPRRAALIGGAGRDMAADLALDAAGNLVLAGWTESDDFPTAPRGLSLRGGGADAFAIGLSADTFELIFSSFLGGQGSGNDRASSIALESDGSIVLAGDTASPDFPVTQHSSNPSYNGGADAFVAKLSPDGSELSFSCFLGGGGDDFGSDLALTRDGSIVLVGSTASLDFPTAAARSPFSSGGWDVFVARLSGDGSKLESLSFLGGSSDDGGWGLPPHLALDPAGGLTIIGATRSADFPAAEINGRPDGGSGWGVFVSRWTSRGEVRRSTLHSGGGADLALALAGDRRGTAWLAGVTNSEDFPLPSMFSLRDVQAGGGVFLTRIEGDPLASLVLLGAGQVVLKAGTVLHSGDVVVNQPGRLSVEKDVRAPAGFRMMADRIDVKKGAVVASNLHFNELNNRGEVSGQLFDFLELPVLAGLPDFPQAAPGDDDVEVRRAASVALEPGAYGRVHLKEDASLHLAGGDYDIRSLDAKSGALIMFEAPTSLRVADFFRTDRQVFVGPAQGAEIDASQILVVAHGDDGHTIELGPESVALANFHAPAGRLRIGAGAVAEGAFLARETVVEPDVEIRLNSVFSDPPPNNRPPVASDDTAVTVEDGAVTVAVLENDTDPDGDPLVIGDYSQGSIGRVSPAPDGAGLLYTPFENLHGTDQFTYRVEDGRGGTDSAVVRISVEPVNDPPLATDDFAELIEDSSVTLTVLENDADPDGDRLILASHGEPAHGVVSEISPGVLEYRPERDFFGRDEFAYVVEDPEGAQSSALVRLAVTPVNDPPVALPDLALTAEDTVAVIPVLANDTDADGDALILLSVGRPTHGDAHGNPDGSVTYIPELNFHGDDFFSYSVGDGAGGFAFASVQVTVTPLNDPPFAADDMAETPEDEGVLVEVLSNDFDPDGDALSLVSFSQPAAGLVEAAGDALRYTPDPDFFGEDRFSYTVSDPAGAVDGADVVVVVSPVNDPPTVELTANPASGTAPLEVLFSAAAQDPDGDPLDFAWDFGDGSGTQGPGPQTHVYGLAGLFTASVQVSDGEFTVRRETVVEVFSSLPPDPASLAPPLDLSAAVTVSAVAEFLHSGDRPIQEGAAAGAFDPVRTALVRGRVLDRLGNPLPGVEVTVMRHPEWGRTLTREDGMYDMTVNGGGPLRFEYRKAGRLPAQRRVVPGWQDFAVVDDVVLVEFDSNVSEIELGLGAPLQTARGTPVSDADGARRATVIFPSETSAEMLMPDGSRQPLDRIGVRATEFTAGDRGPLAMPAELPPASFYTYALALTVDEALQAGAVQVLFSRPVPLYVENFLDFPVGAQVPLGWFDPDRGQWLADDNGLVVGILGVAEGMALLDVDGQGQAAESSRLAELGIGDAERAELAALYAPGQTLWRAPIPHFSFWDLNLGWAPPIDAVYPSVLNFFRSIYEALDRFCSVNGSIIECENQTLGESIPLAGSPWTLNYRSDRALGRRTGRRLQIPLSGSSVPESLDSIELEVEVAGRVHRETFPAEPNLQTTFSWDGRDPYGRQLQGRQTANVRVGYTYQGRYAATDRFNSPSFDITLTPTRTGVTFWEQAETPVGPAWDATGEGLGGWTLSGRHVYDPLGGILYFGDGTRRSVSNLQPVIKTALNSGSASFSSNPDGLAVAPDGTLYIASGIGGQVHALRPDGSVELVAGTGRPDSELGDGGPAVAARLDSPRGVAVAEDGALFIAETDGHRIRRVDPDGTIATVAGTGAAGFSGDGQPAVEAQLSGPLALAVGPDGSLYIADADNRRVRRVTTDGLISTFAGTGEFGTGGDGGGAREARFRTINDLAAASDGSLFVLDSEAATVRRITPDGRIRLFAGSGDFGAFEDGIPAMEARLENPRGIALVPDGGLLISSGTRDRVRLVRPDGIILTVAGVGERGTTGDGGPAASAMLASPGPLACPPQGGYFIGVQGRVRQVSAPLPRFSASDLLVPSEDGSQIYRFDSTGRHLETVHVLTGATLLSLFYDASGMLVQAVDGDGNALIVERDSSGTAQAIVAPLGERTALEMDASGRLAAVTDPTGASFRMQYSSDGLLTSWTNPRGDTSRFEYDGLGLLVRDSDAAGQVQSLSRTELADGYEVLHATALGRAARKSIRETAVGQRVRSSVFPHGAGARVTESLSGSRLFEVSNGTRFETQVAPDPRFGIQSDTSGSLTATTPSGLTLRWRRQVSVVLADPSDPLSAELVTQTAETNGRLATAVYDPTERTLVATSSEGRTATLTVDGQGRPVRRQIGSLTPTTIEYDPLGRLSQIVRGSGPDARTIGFDYDERGCPLRVTDPEGSTLLIECDAAGRIVAQTLSDGRRVAAEYDANGNPTGLIPAGRPAHSFEYNAAQNQVRYGPPDVNPGPDDYLSSYDLDQRLTAITRPDGTEIRLLRDEAGRVQTMEIPRGQVRFQYDDAGSISRITAPDGGAVSFGYDGMLPISTAWSGSVSGIVSRAFNNDFRVSSESVNGDHTVEFSYDGDGLLTAAGPLTVEQDPEDGLLAGTRLANLGDAWAYNGFGEPSAYSAGVAESSLLSFEWTRDKLGRIVAQTETVLGRRQTSEYVYDSSGRLIEVRRDGRSAASYSYDSNGNRIVSSRSGRTVEAVYDDQDRLERHGEVTFAYSAAGQLESRTENDATTFYRYDALGNLTGVTLPDQTEIEYVIDARNRRVGKRINGLLTKGFLYSGQLRVVAELDGAGEVVSRFVYGTRRNVPDYMVRQGRVYRILSDAIGSPRLVVDAESGEIAQQIDYDEFGQVLFDSNPGFQPFGFAGGLDDRQVGLIRFGARDYSPEVGRWTTPDPLAFGGGDLNLYGYALNDPINLIDENGQIVNVLLAGAIIGAGANVFWVAFVNRGNIDLQTALAAAASGAVSGGIGALAGPLGGSIAKFLGSTTTTWLAKGLTIGFSGLGGLLGQALANFIDPDNATSICVAAGTAGLGAGIAGRFITPAKSTRTLSQAGHFRHGLGNLLFFTSGADAFRLYQSFTISSHVSGLSNFF